MLLFAVLYVDYAGPTALNSSFPVPSVRRTRPSSLLVLRALGRSLVGYVLVDADLQQCRSVADAARPRLLYAFVLMASSHETLAPALRGLALPQQ